jgi:hypothetical protein
VKRNPGRHWKPQHRAPCPIVINPALHGRIDLTTIGEAARFWEWLAEDSGCESKIASRERRIISNVVE